MARASSYLRVARNKIGKHPGAHMLKVANLEVVYHSVVLVLDGVSLEVPDGEIVALLGPNGAGKTTTLRAISGLLDIHNGDITKGTITWNGEDLTVKEPEDIVRSRVAQVMEGRRIFPDLTVEENLRAGAHPNPGPHNDDDMETFYERFEVLRERRNQKAGYLSGGEQQMLAIARALMSRPKLLLMDEPSLGLAPMIVERVGELIQELRDDGMTILLVEQNAAMALELADYGYVMENGKIVRDGTSKELLQDEDIQEFYLGVGGEEGKSFRDVKHYRRRKRWLS
jgi:branched-chain amino acid transport system ATP-binding protein